MIVLQNSFFYPKIDINKGFWLKMMSIQFEVSLGKPNSNSITSWIDMDFLNILVFFCLNVSDPYQTFSSIYINSIKQSHSLCMFWNFISTEYLKSHSLFTNAITFYNV